MQTSENDSRRKCPHCGNEQVRFLEAQGYYLCEAVNCRRLLWGREDILTSHKQKASGTGSDMIFYE